MPPGVPFDLRVMRLHSTDTLRGGFCTSDLRPPAGEPGVADGRPQCRPRERGCRRQHPLPRCAGARLGGAAHRHFPHPDVRGTRLFPVAPSPHHARRSGSTCLFKLSQVTGAHRAMAVWARRHTFCAGSPHRCGLQRHRHPGSRGRGRGRCRRDPAQQLYCQPFDYRRACWSRCFWPPTDRRRRLQTRSLWVIRRFRDRKHLPGPVRAFVDLIAEALQDHPLLHAPVWPRQPNGFENQPSGTLRPRRERHDSVANRAPRSGADRHAQHAKRSTSARAGADQSF